MKELRGKVVVVTGASRGLGVALVRELARWGARVVLASREVKAMKKVALGVEERCGVETLVVQVDLEKEADLVKLVDRVKTKFGCIDGVIFNAGMTVKKGAREFTPEEVERVMKVNAGSVMQLTTLVLSEMKSGWLTYVSSLAGWFGASGYGVYAASKHAIDGWVKCVRCEVGSEYRVIIVHPFRLATGFSDASGRSTSRWHKLPVEMYAAYMVSIMRGDYLRAGWWFLRNLGYWGRGVLLGFILGGENEGSGE